MKSAVLMAAVTAASMSFATLSFAESDRWRNQRDESQRFEQRGPGRQGPALDHRGRPAYNHPAQVRNDRGYGARGPQFHRGGRLPNEYRGRQYVVQDWRGRHLHAPQRGQQWVQVGTDYALIAIATGVIAQLVLSR